MPRKWKGKKKKLPHPKAPLRFAVMRLDHGAPQLLVWERTLYAAGITARRMLARGRGGVVRVWDREADNSDVTRATLRAAGEVEFWDAWIARRLGDGVRGTHAMTLGARAWIDVRDVPDIDERIEV